MEFVHHNKCFCLKASALFFVVADLCNAAVLAWDSFFAMYTYVQKGSAFCTSYGLMGTQ